MKGHTYMLVEQVLKAVIAKKHLIYFVLPIELDLRTFFEILSTFDLAYV